MDMSIHMSMLYLDFFIHMPLYRNGIINQHLLSIPVYKSHMAEVIFITVAKALDVLFPLWKETVISISTDSESKVTGCILGVPALFQNVVKPGFVRIWCGAHQLDIVFQGSYSKFGDNNG